MAAQVTYLLAPNFSFKPGTGPIALGTLLADPLRPHRPLTVIDKDALATRYPPVERVVETGKKISRGVGHDVSMSVWTQFLQAIELQLSGERGSHTSTEYVMDTLVTEHFVRDPEEAEIRARLASENVRKAMKAAGFGFRQPVYMVNGLKTAKGLAARKEIKHTRGGSIGAGVPILPPELSAGASVGMQMDSGLSDESKVEGDIIFAYQLLKIELKGRRAEKLKIDELRHKAAYLSLDDDTTGGADADAEDTKDLDVEVLVSGVQDLEDLDIEEGEEEEVSLVKIGVDGQELSVVVFQTEDWK